MTLPPRRLFDVWSDLDYEFAESKSERLLMAALVLSGTFRERMSPPSRHAQFSGRLRRTINRKILYVPIGQLSPTKLKKLRVVHVLDSYERRAEAKEYIW